MTKTHRSIAALLGAVVSLGLMAPAGAYAKHHQYKHSRKGKSAFGMKSGGQYYSGTAPISLEYDSHVKRPAALPYKPYTKRPAAPGYNPYTKRPAAHGFKNFGAPPAPPVDSGAANTRGPEYNGGDDSPPASPGYTGTQNAPRSKGNSVPGAPPTPPR